jgi:hypothetical protein
MEDPKTHAGKIINVSSANHNGRAVGSSLAVFADENGQGAFNSPP